MDSKVSLQFKTDGDQLGGINFLLFIFGNRRLPFECTELILIKNITPVFLFFQVWLEQSPSRLRRTLTRWWHCGTDRRTSCWAAPTTPLTLTCGQYCSIIVVNCTTTTKSLCDQLTEPVLPKQQTCLSLCLSACRGVGCIFYEMTTGRPLFPGSTVEEELHFIFKLLGENQSASVIFIHRKLCIECIWCVWCVFCVQVHQQRKAGLGSVLMTSLWLTTILSTERIDWVTTLPGTRLYYTLVHNYTPRYSPTLHSGTPVYSHGLRCCGTRCNKSWTAWYSNVINDFI